MENREWKAIIEGLLFAAGDEGLSVKELSEITELSKQEVQMFVNEMMMEWKLDQRGIQMVQVAKVYQLTTLAEHNKYFEKLASAPTRSQLSRAALETLAIIAYRQPITRLEIEEIRGVKTDRTVQLLQRKGLVRETGRAEGPGRPILLGTTKEFLEYFGLNRLEDLPAPDSLFNWQEMEQERHELFERLGVEKV
ncbi:SMC-Scp complex subunit ScpB [Thermoactinomyces sp. DSM 45892]|uniref:SMC-Scp complex subunit ScpB n=1 Tax=Thermoactinomyces sp. DSM 45892 TaxID=1882753 RepID=UPI000B83A32C|nr:SMC-Scp complex subunit ScpB [Thermoactinomyces sp. DSM 45892]